MSRVCLMGKRVVRRPAAGYNLCLTAKALENRLYPLIYVVHVPTGSTLYIKKYRNENITSIKASSARKRFLWCIADKQLHC